MRTSLVLLRRGKPRPRYSLFPDRFRRVPQALKPMQGGQQSFHQLALKAADDRIAEETGGQSRGSTLGQPDPAYLPEGNWAARDSIDEALAADVDAMQERDAFVTKRAFNEREWYDSVRNPQQRAEQTNIMVRDDATEAPALLPDRVTDNEYFKSQFGYSLVKESTLPVNPSYSQLDLWGELPKYAPDMYFFYVISRRRNTYAVCFDYYGKKLLKTYSVGNRGLKGGDKGARGDGSVDNGHQVASMYLNDLIPKIREERANAGKTLAKGEKVDVVLRIMGFYNGRQGAVRALTDRSDMFNVRYVEDITPFPLNGPKMPRGIYK